MYRYIEFIILQYNEGSITYMYMYVLNVGVTFNMIIFF